MTEKALDPETWQSFVDLAFPGARKDRATSLEGGNFTDVFLLSLTTAAGQAVDVVVRRMRGSETAPVVRTLAWLLPRVREHGVRAPEVLWADPSGDVLGAPAIAYTWIDGDAYGHGLDPENRAIKQAEALALIHLVPLEHGGVLGTYPAVPGAHLRRWITQTADADQALRLVDERAPTVPMAESRLVHGDYWTGNLLWQGQRLVGVLDWDNVASGCRGADVGKARLDLALQFGVAVADRFSEHYSTLAGRVPDHDFWNLREALAGFPDPGLYWLPTYDALGSEGLSTEVVRANFREYIGNCLDACR